jgi:hypothetical protein
LILLAQRFTAAINASFLVSALLFAESLSGHRSSDAGSHLKSNALLGAFFSKLLAAAVNDSARC